MSCPRVRLSVKASIADSDPIQIAIGGTIGTGLFVGSGGALAAGGPVGVWVRHDGVAFLAIGTDAQLYQLGYIFMSTMVYAMMVALGGKSAIVYNHRL